MRGESACAWWRMLSVMTASRVEVEEAGPGEGLGKVLWGGRDRGCG